MRGVVIQSEWYILVKSRFVLSEEVFANAFGWSRYVALAWKDENNIVAQLSLRD